MCICRNSPLPLSASRSFVALRVVDGGRNPVTILLIIPFLGLLGICDKYVNPASTTSHRNRKHTWVGDDLRLVIEPALGLLSLLVEDLVGSILIPVIGLCEGNKYTLYVKWRICTNLGGIRVRNALSIDPVLRLLVFGVVNLLGRVN